MARILHLTRNWGNIRGWNMCVLPSNAYTSKCANFHAWTWFQCIYNCNYRENTRLSFVFAIAICIFTSVDHLSEVSRENVLMIEAFHYSGKLWIGSPETAVPPVSTMQYQCSDIALNWSIFQQKPRNHTEMGDLVGIFMFQCTFLLYRGFKTCYMSSTL